MHSISMKEEYISRYCLTRLSHSDISPRFLIRSTIQIFSLALSFASPFRYFLSLSHSLHHSDIFLRSFIRFTIQILSPTSANSGFGCRSRKRRPLIFAIFADNSPSQLKSSATVTHSLILTNEQRSLRSLRSLHSLISTSSTLR
jgi:hypothetical protein